MALLQLNAYRNSQRKLGSELRTAETGDKKYQPPMGSEQPKGRCCCSCCWSLEKQEAHQIVSPDKTVLQCLKMWLTWSRNCHGLTSNNKHFNDACVGNCRRYTATWIVYNTPPAIFVLSGAAFRSSPANYGRKKCNQLLLDEYSGVLPQIFNLVICELSCLYVKAWGTI